MMQLVAHDAELGQLLARLKLTISLVRSAAAVPAHEAPAPEAPRQLAPERREKLLKHFKLPTPRQLGVPLLPPKKKFPRWILPALAGTAVLVIMAGLFGPTLGGSSKGSRLFSHSSYGLRGSTSDSGETAGSESPDGTVLAVSDYAAKVLKNVPPPPPMRMLSMDAFPTAATIAPGPVVTSSPLPPAGAPTVVAGKPASAKGISPTTPAEPSPRSEERFARLYASNEGQTKLNWGGTAGSAGFGGGSGGGGAGGPNVAGVAVAGRQSGLAFGYESDLNGPKGDRESLAALTDGTTASTTSSFSTAPAGPAVNRGTISVSDAGFAGRVVNQEPAAAGNFRYALAGNVSGVTDEKLGRAQLSEKEAVLRVEAAEKLATQSASQWFAKAAETTRKLDRSDDFLSRRQLGETAQPAPADISGGNLYFDTAKAGEASKDWDSSAATADRPVSLGTEVAVKAKVAPARPVSVTRGNGVTDLSARLPMPTLKGTPEQLVEGKNIESLDKTLAQQRADWSEIQQAVTAPEDQVELRSVNKRQAGDSDVKLFAKSESALGFDFADGLSEAKPATATPPAAYFSAGVTGQTRDDFGVIRKRIDAAATAPANQPASVADPVPVLGDVPTAGRFFRETQSQEAATPVQEDEHLVSNSQISNPESRKKSELGLKRLEQTVREESLAKEETAKQLKAEPPPPPKAPASAPVPQPEVVTAENPFSTFSLNVADVSFKLAQASLEKGVMPEAASIRSEEFINALDYRDPEPAPGAPIAFAWERSRYPFAHNRDALRFSVKTAAAGRAGNRPLNLVLLLDNSGSMERADRVQIIREALRVLATLLQPQDKVSVVAFARTARLWVDGLPGSQAGELVDRVGNLTPQGGTNLEDAMAVAYRTALGYYMPNGMNRVVLLTDGAANLGDVSPASLKEKVEHFRKQGIALDCFGIGWEGYNDDLLETLSRNGDGRYGFVNTPEAAATEFAAQLAGALQVAASDVKVQVEFNPARVTAYRQVGYAKHQLTKEQFRDNTVDAAEIAAAEAGNGLYIIEANPQGQGAIATVRVRYKVPGTADYRELEWTVPYTGAATALEQASPAMRLCVTAAAFSEWLAGSPFAGEVNPTRLLPLLAGVPQIYGADKRPEKLEWMVRQAKSASGR